jgi:YtkA-like
VSGLAGTKPAASNKRRFGQVGPPRWRFVLALAVGLLPVLGCHPRGPSSGVSLESEIMPQPARVGPITVSLKLSNPSGQPVSGAHVALEGDMSHPGMAPVFGDTKETAPGRYQGSLQLTMGGDWVVLTHITLADGRKLDREIALSDVHP